MSKLDEYIEKTKKALATMETQKEKGYDVFFESLSELSYPNDPYREFIFEYLVASVAHFFEQNGVEYSPDVRVYSKKVSYYDSSILFENVNNSVINSKKAVSKKAESANITLHDGYLDFQAILYAMYSIPKMRDSMVEVFGPELISEEIFPDFTKVGQKLEKVTRMATAILEKRKIDSLSDEELIERAIKEDKNIERANQAIEEITGKIKAIEESIQQNGIYTLENHPTYGKLKGKLGIQTEAREAAIKSLRETSPSDLRKSIMFSSEIVDYEKMYEDEKRSRNMEAELKKEGTNPEEAIKYAADKVQHAKFRLSKQADRKARIEYLTEELALLESLIQSDEFSTYYRVSAEKTNAEKEKWEKEEDLRMRKQEKEKIEAIIREYESMGFFQRRSDRGKELKAIIDREKQNSSDIDSLYQIKVAEAVEKAEQVDKRYEVATEQYGVVYDSLNQDGILDRIFHTHSKASFLALASRDIKDRHEQVSRDLCIEKRAFEEVYRKSSDEELRETIDTYSGRAEAIKAMLEQRERHENIDEVFFESLETAVDLVNDTTVEVNEEQDVVSSRK